MATKHTCPVFVIVHTNPPAKGVSSGDEKERGHFGSSLMRKCYSILNVSKKGDVSTVQGRNLRRARSGVGFQFMWMDNIHLHMEVGQDHKVDIEADRKAEKIKQWKIDAAHVFGQSTPTYKEAVTGVMKTLDCSEKTAKRRLQDWRENGIIKASDIDKKYRLDI